MRVPITGNHFRVEGQALVRPGWQPGHFRISECLGRFFLGDRSQERNIVVDLQYNGVSRSYPKHTFPNKKTREQCLYHVLDEKAPVYLLLSSTEVTEPLVAFPR
jgi:hypothetical protein